VLLKKSVYIGKELLIPRGKGIMVDFIWWEKIGNRGTRKRKKS
jgi:hypothetical protein